MSDKTVFSISILLACVSVLSGCSHAPQIPAPSLNVYVLSPEVAAGTTAAGQKVNLGGFSSLLYDKAENGRLYFWSVTDRGPNGLELKNGSRPFLLPKYSPRIVSLSLNPAEKSFRAEKFQSLKKVTGLPPSSSKDKAVETAVDIRGKKLKPDPQGVDSEGLCLLNGRFLVSDEYGPDLIELGENMQPLRRWGPGHGLPAELNSRKINRGLEGLACGHGYAYLFLQSPLKSGLAEDHEKIRLLKFSPDREKTVAQYFYPVETKIADKIGDLALVQDEIFLVIEQNGKIGPEGVRKIYRIDLAKAGPGGVLTKELLLDLNTLGFDQAEKIEGITVLDASTIAINTDNDFGIDGQVDFKTGRAGFKESAPSYLAIIRLGEKLF